MGFFDLFKFDPFPPDKDIDDIRSVVILDETQLYRSVDDIGFGLGGSSLSDVHIFSLGSRQVPDGTRITFSVTYKDGSRNTITERAGTQLCNRLLQIALDPPKTAEAETEKHEPFRLEKNQLPNGSYLIGKDIPAGTFDFTWVFGTGYIMKFENDHDTTLGATTYYEHMGNKELYEHKQCINVDCREGELLKINGNLVVLISRSQNVEIDL